jgi:hypothetical protein
MRAFLSPDKSSGFITLETGQKGNKAKPPACPSHASGMAEFLTKYRS